jgi:ABC-2 type transport system permease protein
MLLKILVKIKTFLVVYYAYMLEYRAELLLWALSGSLPIILMGVWIKASTNADFGLESVDFARYFITVFFVRQMTVVWVAWEFEGEVVEGRLSFALLQPIDPVWRHVAMHLSERLARMPFTIMLLVLFFGLYPNAFWLPSFSQVFLAAIAIIIAFILRFLIQYTFAMFAFWVERASAIEQFWFLLYLFLSGYIAPLDVFPPLMREIALWTPFPYVVHIPAALLIGLPVDIPRSILVIIGWTTLFLVINRWLWYQGLKRYSGMGA